MPRVRGTPLIITTVNASKMEVRARPSAQHLPMASQLSKSQILSMASKAFQSSVERRGHSYLIVSHFLLSSFCRSFMHLLWPLLGVLSPGNLHSNFRSPSNGSNSISLKSSLNSLKTNWQSSPPSPCFISSIGLSTHYLSSVLLCWDVRPITAGNFSSLLYSWQLTVPGTS